MSTAPPPATGPPPRAAGHAPRPLARAGRTVGPALMRYRVMAVVTGVFLLVLTVEVFLKYVLRVDVGEAGRVIAITHGWIYVAYLVTVFDLWSKLRWRFGRLVALVLAGVVPVLSFVVERRIVREVRAAEAVSTTPPPTATTEAAR